jgi:hypothetical protein
MQSGERGRSLDGSPPESVCLDRPANQPTKGVSNQPSSAASHALAAGRRLTEPWSEPYLFAGGATAKAHHGRTCSVAEAAMTAVWVEFVVLASAPRAPEIVPQIVP